METQTQTWSELWTEIESGLTANGAWFAADDAESTPSGPTGERVEVIARGMHVGSGRYNSHQVKFPKAAAEQAIRELSGSLVGRDGHVSGSAYGDTVIYWNHVEMGQQVVHSAGGQAWPIYFFGTFSQSAEAQKSAAKFREAAANQVPLFTSVGVIPDHDEIVWEKDGPTFDKFRLSYLDFVTSPSDPEAKAQLLMDGNHGIRFNDESQSFIILENTLQPVVESEAITVTEESPMGTKNETNEETQEHGQTEQASADPQVTELQARMTSVEATAAQAESRATQAEARIADRESLDMRLDALSDLPADLRFDADRAIRSKFATLRSEKPDDAAETLAELAYAQGVSPFLKQVADQQLEALREGQTDSEPVEATLSVTDVFESETGRPAFERLTVALLDAWERTGNHREKFRGEAETNLLPSTFDYSKSHEAGLQWQATRRMMDELATKPVDPKNPRGATYEDALIVESRLFQESNGDHRVFLESLTEHARNHPGMWQFATLSDFVAPRSVDMMPINAIYPMIPAIGLYDTGMADTTKYTVTVEDYNPVESTAFTATITGVSVPVGGSYDLGRRHIDPDSTFTMVGLTEGTDYALEHARGFLHNISAAAISLGNVTAGKYFTFSLGEATTPVEVKTDLQEFEEDLWWDRVRVTYSREAEIEPLANAGYPTASRLQFAAMFQVRELIARDLAGTAWFALRYGPGANKYPVGKVTTDIDKDAYEAFGEMCAERKDAGFSPTVGVMSYGTADAYTNLTDYFGSDGLVSAQIDGMNMIRALKGMPVVPLRYWKIASTSFPRVATCQPPIARYRLLANNGIQTSAPQSSFDASGNILDGTQYLIRVCHFTGSIYQNEHNAWLSGTTT